LKISSWANKYLKLPNTAAEPGQYKTARTPYVKEIMDSFNQSAVKKIVVKSSSQIGKSQMLLAIVGYYVHLNPCNLMIIQPTLELAQDFSKSRLQKMIEDTPVLTPLFYDLNKTRNSNQTILSKNFTGGRIVLVGANSPSGLASRPIKILLADEVDRYPISSGDEGNPVDLAAKRQTTYWDYKTALFSTPTVEGESMIDAEYQLGTQEEWQHRCKNCGEFHCLDYRNMQVDFDEHLDEYKNRTIIVKSVKWRCPDCGMEFSEIEVKNTEQRYIVKNPAALSNGVRSFFINGFTSPWVSWAQIMTEYLTARGNPAREAVVFNTRFGVSYKLTGEYNDETHFLERRESYPAELPDGVLILTGAVDVQANRLEILIGGWGIDEEFFGIWRGIVRGSPNDIETWQRLDSILNKEYKYQNGDRLKISRVFIDSGYATDAVYAYCRLNQYRNIFPIKGTGQIGAPLIFKYSYPKNSGIILTILGVNTGKSEIFSRLGIEKAGAQFLHFPNNPEANFDINFFKQLIAERRVVRKSGGLMVTSWETISKGVRNEALDLMNYNLAAMKSLEIKDWNNFKRQKPIAQVKPVSKKIISHQINIF